MNIIEAIKSGRPFSRRSDKGWHGPFVKGDGYTEVRMELSDLLADDWEIQEPKVEITASQFWAYVEATLGDYVEGPPRVIISAAMNVLARRLGLEK